MRTRLTKSAVAALEVTPTRYKRWDATLPGFGVLVLPSGVKSWIVRYRTAAGVDRTHTIGRVEELTPEEAREEARRVRGESRLGKDPTAERRAQRNCWTVEQLAAEFERVHKPLVKPQTWTNYDGYWRNHLVKRWPGRRVDSITPLDIRDWRADYADRPVTYNRCREVLAMALDLAVEANMLTQNVARVGKVRDFKEKARKRALSPEEMVAMGRAMAAMADKGDLRWRFVALITLLLLTGCRLNEILSARWGWVRWNRGVVEWPDTKTGEDTGVLPDAAMALLRQLKDRAPASAYVICGQDCAKPMGGYRKLWVELKKAAGITGLRIHDLRKSFASVALAEGMGLEVIASLLRHSDPSVTARHYAFLQEHSRREAANRAADRVTAALQSPDGRG